MVQKWSAPLTDCKFAEEPGNLVSCKAPAVHPGGSLLLHITPEYIRSTQLMEGHMGPTLLQLPLCCLEIIYVALSLALAVAL